MKGPRIGLAERLTLFVSVLLILTGASIAYYSFYKQRSLLLEEFEKRGLSLVKALAESSLLPVLTNDRNALQSLVTAMKKEADIVYVVIEGLDGEALGTASSIADIPGEKGASGPLLWKYFESLDGKKIYEASYPVELETPAGEEGLKALYGLSPEGGKTIKKRIAIARIGFTPEKIMKTISSIRNSGILMTLSITLPALLFLFLLVRTALRPIHELVGWTQEIAKGNLNQGISVRSRDEISLLAQSMERMRLDLLKHIQETSERERMAKELSMARQIQMNLLPARSPDIDGLEVMGICVPAMEVGGDYYDFIELSRERLGIVIGDVSGKGVSAALLVSFCKGAVQFQARMGMEIGNFLSEINRIICKSAQKRMMTFLYSVIEVDQKKLVFSNAGHNFPYIYRSQGRSLESLELGAFPLGMKNDEIFPFREVPIEKGDTIILYSDGIVEALNNQDEMFSFERFEESIRKNIHLPVRRFRDALIEEVRSFCGERPLEDDMTLVVARLT